MKLLTKSIRDRLIANGKAQDIVRGTKHEFDLKPVVKLFTPWGACTWLLSELDPTNPDIVFGLCDLGVGCPELGAVSISELESIRGPFGLRIERDIHWTPVKTINAYAEDAYAAERIVA